MDCIFCKIVNETVKVEAGFIIYSDDLVIAFHAREKAAPVHVVIVPRRHIASLDEIQYIRYAEESFDTRDIGHALVVASGVARKLGLTNGYRVVINTGEDAGQTVKHAHLHLLGGRKLGALG